MRFQRRIKDAQRDETGKPAQSHHVSVGLQRSGQRADVEAALVWGVFTDPCFSHGYYPFCGEFPHEKLTFLSALRELTFLVIVNPSG